MESIAHEFEQRKAAREAWAALLSRYPWTFFATITYRLPQSPESIRKGFCRWLSLWLEETAVGADLAKRDATRVDHRGRPKLLGWFANQRRRSRLWPPFVLGVEPHKSGRLHSHAVVKWPDGMPPADLQVGWLLAHKLFGRSKVEAPRSSQDVAAYCSKYVCKHESELVLSRSFDAAHPLFANAEKMGSGCAGRDMGAKILASGA